MSHDNTTGKDQVKKKTIARVVKDKNNPYVQINKTCLKDMRLSWKAKGLLSYILSMPDDWVFYIEELETHSSDGIFATRSAVDELKKYGYIERYAVRLNGKIDHWEFLIHEFPIPVEVKPSKVATVDFSSSQKPSSRKPSSRKPHATNTDSTKNDFNNNHNDLNDVKKEPQLGHSIPKKSLKTRELAFSSTEAYVYQKLLKINGIHRGAAIQIVEKYTVGDIEYALETSLFSHVENRTKYILGCFFKKEINN